MGSYLWISKPWWYETTYDMEHIYLQFQAVKLNDKTELDDITWVYSEDRFSQNIRSLPSLKLTASSPLKAMVAKGTDPASFWEFAYFQGRSAVSLRECISQNLSPKENPWTDHMVGYVGANSLGSCNLLHLTGQIIATSHDLGPKKVAEKEKSMEIPLFHGNLGWWNIILARIWVLQKRVSTWCEKKNPTVEQLLREIQVRQQQNMEKIRAQTASGVSSLNQPF